MRSLMGQTEVILNRTAFYPTSGGQPCDLGDLNGLNVVDVREDGDAVIHVLDASLEDEEVHGQIDWDRRWDHMQQHSGQHILSQAFIRAAGAQTMGFHLGKEESTIDLDKSELSEQTVEAVERLANGIVFENRAIGIRRVSRKEAETIHFRKMPSDESEIRLVEVEQFDRSGCCGTHVRHTGEVGLVKIIRWERYKGGTRVTFLCGVRAVGDYQKKTRILREISRTLTAGEDDVPEVVSRWKDEKKALGKRLRSLVEEKSVFEANELKSRAERIGSRRYIKICFEDRDPQEVQVLVRQIARTDDCIVLAGVKSDRVYLYFGCGKGVGVDVRPLLEAACRIVAGRGGGSPGMAQGNGSDLSKMGEALAAAEEMLVQALQG